MPEKSYFNKFLKNLTGSEAILAATKSRVITISDTDLENYGPFVYFRLENRSTELIRVTFNAAVLGDDSIIGTKTKTAFVPAGNAYEMTPYSDGRPDIVVNSVLLTNEDAANDTAADEVTWELKNW